MSMTKKIQNALKRLGEAQVSVAPGCQGRNTYLVVLRASSKRGPKWTLQQSELALDAYMADADGRYVRKLGRAIGRTTNSLTFKFSNFRSLRRPGQGAPHVASVDRQAWREFKQHRARFVRQVAAWKAQLGL